MLMLYFMTLKKIYKITLKEWFEFPATQAATAPADHFLAATAPADHFSAAVAPAAVEQFPAAFPAAAYTNPYLAPAAAYTLPAQVGGEFHMVLVTRTRT